MVTMLTFAAFLIACLSDRGLVVDKFDQVSGVGTTR
jgi:hypothetical protein